jgi:PRTRC genetic system protein A
MIPNGVSYHIHRRPDDLLPIRYGFVMHRGGVAKVVRSRFFRAVTTAATGHIPGLPPLQMGFEWLAPPIPVRLLAVVLEDARQFGPGGTMIEQMYQFHLTPDGWQVARPRQQATAGRIIYRPGDDRAVGLELHSHHGMNAYFSATDNRDEVDGGRLYGVIGRIYSAPEIRLRAGLYGDWIPVRASQIFNGLIQFKERYDE